MTKQRLLGLTCLLVAALAQGACGTTASVQDGQTHWLKSCSEDADCQEGLLCQCGLCMQECGADSECNVVSDTAECVPPDWTAAEDACSTSAASMCLETCVAPRDCASDQYCLTGVCLPDPDGTKGCYSPEQNLDFTYDAELQGCVCDPEVDEDACIADSTGQEVALICREGRWSAVEDGPCELLPRSNCGAGCPSGTVCGAVLAGGYQSCVSTIVPSTVCYEHPASECCADADCASGTCQATVSYPSGVCGLGGADPINACLSDECDADADCGTGAVCAWPDIADVRRVCLPAACTSDSDCGPAGVCAVVSAGCVNLEGVSTERPRQLACTYPNDYCTQDTDCPSGSYCVVDDGVAHCQGP